MKLASKTHILFILFIALWLATNALSDSLKSEASIEEYVKGRNLYLSFSSDNMPAAIKHLKRAIELDSTNLRALYSLSDAYATYTLMLESEQDVFRTKSQEIDQYLINLSRKHEQAVGFDLELLSEFSERIKGRLEISLGKWEAAETNLKRPIVLKSELELSKGRDISYGLFLLSVGRINEAEYFLSRAKDTDKFAAVTYNYLARIYAANSDFAKSHEIINQGLNLYTHQDTSTDERWHPLLRRTALFTALASRNKRKIINSALSIKSTDLGAGELDKALATQLSDGQALNTLLRKMWSEPVNRHGYRAESIAYWAAYADETELSIEALEHLPNDLATYAYWHPVMANIRKQLKFNPLVKKRGLLQYWTNTGSWSDFCRPVDLNDFVCE